MAEQTKVSAVSPGYPPEVSFDTHKRGCNNASAAYRSLENEKNER